MLGRFHLLISTIYIFSFAWALHIDGLISQQTATILILSGALGSLIPDVDASDAAILHGETKEIGYGIKYTVYYPIAYLANKLFGVEKKHRGIMHSLIGLLLTNLILTPLIYTYVTVYSLVTETPFLDIAAIPPWIILGISIGFILHMVEDSFTKSGVQWFLPKKHVISGNIRTFSKEEKKFAEALIILGVIPLLISIYVGATLIVTTIIIIELLAAYTYTKYIIKK